MAANLGVLLFKTVLVLKCRVVFEHIKYDTLSTKQHAFCLHHSLTFESFHVVEKQYRARLVGSRSLL